MTAVSVMISMFYFFPHRPHLLIDVDQLKATSAAHIKNAAQPNHANEPSVSARHARPFELLRLGTNFRGY